MRKFFVLGLPRSRTYWMSVFLGCTHEGYNYYPNYKVFMDSNGRGDSTTCYPWIKEYVADSPIVVIDRDIKECFESSLEIFPHVQMDNLEYMKKELDSINNCLRVKYDDVSDRLEEIWNYCREDDFDKNRADLMKDKKMENHSLIRSTQIELEKIHASNT